MQNLHELPFLRDSLSYHYVEYAIVEKAKNGVIALNEAGKTAIPTADLSLLMLGPGTSISSAAITTLARTGCLVAWVGQDGTRYYASGMGETRQARRELHQAKLVSYPHLRQRVVLRMYHYRFADRLSQSLTLPQIRGKEGARMRQAYADASRKYGVPWNGRRYDRSKWGNSDPINRALSSANSLLNDLCQTAIISGGYSPALGFIHTGKKRSFVFDIADLYKVDLTIPIAFEIIAESDQKITQRVRALCRERFREYGLLNKILPDIDKLLDIPLADMPTVVPGDIDSDGALPTKLWEKLQ